LAKIPFVKEAITNFFKSPVTNRYPYAQPVVPKTYRGRIRFNADLCVGCGMCMRVCSPTSITKTVKTLDDTQEITMSFDMSSCTFCGMCADFCGKKAIDFSQEYSMLAFSSNKSDLIVEGTFTKKLPPKPAPKPVGSTENQTVKKADNEVAASIKDESKIDKPTQKKTE
jgi:formate hydrogenlyase subunit 6/NADH:ubiquinone oxidoreductase subunit I